MLYEQLKRFINKSGFFRNLNDKLAEKGLFLYNLNSSAKALIVAHVFFETKKNVILVSGDDLQAEEYLDDLEILAGRSNAFFLPDFEVLPYEDRSPHYTIRSQRIDAMAKTVSSEPAIYSVPLRAFLRKIINKEIFSRNLIELRKNSEMNPDNLLSRLVAMGYEMNYSVSKVGDVARRGGIIDVYSPNFDRPVRIDFFGDEIESLRHFSVMNQRSDKEYLEKVTLIPSREFSIHDIEAQNKAWEKVRDGGFYEGIEQDIPLLFNNTSNFIDYFPIENSFIIWDEFQNNGFIVEDILSETLGLWEKTRIKTPRRLITAPDQLFSGKEFIGKCLKTYEGMFISTGYSEFIEKKTDLPCPFTSQTVLNGNLPLLENELRKKLDSDIRIFIQSDNRSQSKRMMDLLPDFEDKITFTIGVLHKGFEITDASLSIMTDHEIFSRYKSKKNRDKFSKEQALIDYDSLKPGDFIVHIDHGIGVFEGLVTMKIAGNTIECLSLRYADDDHVYVPTFQLRLVSKFVSEEGFEPAIHKIGGKMWQKAKQTAKKQIELVAQDLVDLYAERKLRKGVSFDQDSAWQIELEESFIYEDTPDQSRASREIKTDMESETPMERLLCGDVGFGKTEVAVRAAFKAVMGGMQVAILVPTTLLAEQHFLVFKERMAQYPVTIEMFSRFRAASRMTKDIAGLVAGSIDIAIGTHRLLSNDVKFKRLGLLIVDEEHRFGVRHKEKLRKLKSNVDTLYMSATPIPRTLNMALSKLKEMSLIQTSPKERLPVRTVVIPYDEEVIKDALNRELDRGGQVFFLHNRVQTIDNMAADIARLVPKARVRVGHGQLPERILEEIMIDFAHHNFDILVASTIIESGIDIPNANTIIINRADMFGLAQLYQLRGRVGRSNRRAYAYLIIPQKLNDLARKRLETLTEYNTLGAGYQIAMRDLELRGAGSFLGTKQSGVINSIGFNYYNRLLEKAIKSIEEQHPENLWQDDDNDRKENVRISADYYFPADYISDEKTRLELYRRMLSLETIEKYTEFETELEDRFGQLPEMARNTLLYYKIKFYTDRLGLESFRLKDGEAIIEFPQKNLPNREKIGKLINAFSYPVSFESTGNLKIKFKLTDNALITEKKALLNSSLKILDLIYKW